MYKQSEGKTLHEDHYLKKKVTKNTGGDKKNVQTRSTKNSRAKKGNQANATCSNTAKYQKKINFHRSDGLSRFITTVDTTRTKKIKNRKRKQIKRRFRDDECEGEPKQTKPMDKTIYERKKPSSGLSRSGRSIPAANKIKVPNEREKKGKRTNDKQGVGTKNSRVKTWPRNPGKTRRKQMRVPNKDKWFGKKKWLISPVSQ